MIGEKFQYTIITKDNWQQYMELPNHIIEKVENGKITLTHFSDIIRAELIKNYGGVWEHAKDYQHFEMPDEWIQKSSCRKM